MEQDAPSVEAVLRCDVETALVVTEGAMRHKPFSKKNNWKFIVIH